jgi:hypothetical protein
MHFDIAQVQTYQWVLAVVSGMVIGMSKAGLSGLTLMFIPLMALSFGGKASTGILLPMLCVGDIFAVSWYRRHAETEHLLRLLPSALVGIGAGVAVGGSLSDSSFRIMLGSFRGAMQGRADKGIIMTTGRFTSEARKEAVRDGVPPIELLDGERVIDMFTELELGLRPVTAYEIDEEFFDEFR